MSGIHEQFDYAMERMEDIVKEGAPVVVSTSKSLGWIQRGGKWYEIQVVLQGDENEWIKDPGSEEEE